MLVSEDLIVYYAYTLENCPSGIRFLSTSGYLSFPYELLKTYGFDGPPVTLRYTTAVRVSVCFSS